ncbi:T9SS type A sorting domain-containing protein, partial [Aquimarina litoralis]|uniref:T9SS type A sorting domain-containing protein n=1 Tax=Aquimarina litoralis TaxID=584605 RepID=UPI001C56CFC7
YNNRAYQFIVEGSSISPTSGFFVLTDASNNTSGGSVIHRSFSPQSVRYVKLTITGASGYTGNWSSIREFEIICSGTTQSLSNRTRFDELTNVSVYPNPFTKHLTIELPKNNTEITKIQIIDVHGREVFSKPIVNSSNNINFATNLPRGIYFLRLLSPTNKVIKVKKIISDSY